MAYNKTVWQNWITDLNENNMNKIENELELLGGKTVTTANEDVNNYTKEGVYYFGASHTPNNIPSGVNGWLVVWVNGDWIKQLWFRHGSQAGANDYETFVRTRFTNVSSDWSSWRRFIVEDELYYKSGDTISINGVILNGYVTSSAETITLLLYTPKKLNNITSLNITLLVGNIRGTNGYIDSDYTATTNFNSGDFTNTLYKKSDNMINIEITKSTAFTNATNNTPISAFLNLQISLS